MNKYSPWVNIVYEHFLSKLIALSNQNNEEIRSKSTNFFFQLNIHILFVLILEWPLNDRNAYGKYTYNQSYNNHIVSKFIFRETCWTGP